MDSFESAFQFSPGSEADRLAEAHSDTRTGRTINNAITTSASSRKADDTIHVLLVGQSADTHLVRSALRAERFSVDTCNFISTALLASDDISFDIIMVIADKPVREIHQATEHESIFNILRQRSVLIAVAVGEDAEIEPTYLEAGFDTVIPVQEFSTAVCTARIKAVLRRVNST